MSSKRPKIQFKMFDVISNPENLPIDSIDHIVLNAIASPHYEWYVFHEKFSVNSFSSSTEAFDKTTP